MAHFTALGSSDNINPESLNRLWEELSNAINQLEAGELTQTTPTINSFINAGHNHQDDAGGGQITVDAIDAESSTAGQVMATDGSGGYAWSNSVGSVLGFTDTPSKYVADGYLRIGQSGTAIEFGAVAVEDYVADEGSNYTTTSTSFVDVDATNLVFTLQTGGGDILVACVATLGGAGVIANFDLEVDGTRLGADAGIASRGLASGNVRPLVVMGLLTGLAAGEHVIKLQWSSTFGGTVTMYAGPTTNYRVHPQLFALEIV